MSHRPLPTSTHRLQLTSQFTFDDAAEVCGYLRTLGVGWVYVSPVLQAQPGSHHGYDVIDHAAIDAERGGRDAFERFCESAHREGLGVLVDIVPNHVGVETPELNRWWWELLREGRDSRMAEAFDVDWDAAGGRIRIPVLGESPDELDRLVIEGDMLAYYDHRYPIAVGTHRDGDSALEVHARQHYELVCWRRADAELNYRRFFAVNSLAGIRVEEPWVFDESHTEVSRWFREGLVDGLRVDHPDGLADPTVYLAHLSVLIDGAPIWVEKILEGDEELPAGWATLGTTGYDALGDFDRVLVDALGREGLQSAQQQLSPGELQSWSWDGLVFASKRSVAEGILRSEVNRLARLMPEAHGAGVEAAGVDAAAEALIALLAVFPVYRSYLPRGRDYLETARELALRRFPEKSMVIDAVVKILADPSHAAAIRFQQTSGMVMAKGVEDSAFYRFSALTSLNEVGADPDEFAIDTQQFHERQMRRQRDWPHSMTTLSTHDTKRAEDVRARITVLSECPELWKSALAQLHPSANLGDAALENLVWQAVIGAWPASRERLHGYAEKAAREAGTSTTWTDPNTEFEKKLHAMVDAAFDDPAVFAVLNGTVDEIKQAGFSNGLSMKLLQLCAPGTPDVYQGSELWETSLVDPDNRRPVDFASPASLLARIDAGWLPPVDETGAAKLLITSRALRLRHSNREWFTSYRPLTATGPASDHVVAFDRGGAIALATRLPRGLAEAGGWRETSIALPDTECIDVITGRVFAGGSTLVAELFASYPVALVTSA